MVELNGSPFLTTKPLTAIAIDRTGTFLFGAQFGGFGVDRATGVLSPLPLTVSNAYNVNSMATDSTGPFLYLADTCFLPGCVGHVLGYAIDADTGGLTPVNGSPYPELAAPQAVTIDAAGQFAYLANWYSEDVSVYSVDPSAGTLVQVSGSPFPAGSTPAAIVTTSGPAATSSRSAK